MEAAVDARHAISPYLHNILRHIKGFGNKMFGDQPVVDRFGEAKAWQDSGFKEFVSNTLEFDIGSLLSPSSFLYILIGMGIILFQTHNNLAINNLAFQNERLREQIQMTSSVITSQELKMDELHSIRNIAQDASALGLVSSSIPPVEIEP